MTDLTLEPQWIAQIARGALDTKPMSIAVAEALVRHNLALAVAATIPVGTALTLAEQVLVADRKSRLMEMMAVVATTIRISELLNKHGIAHLSLKGPALSVQTTGGWEGRSSCDVDLLINPADYRKVHRAFLGAGLCRRDGHQAPAGAFFRWSACEVGYHGTLVNIDLHWRMDPSPALYDASLDQLLARAEIVEIRGVKIKTLGRLDAWLFTAVHGARSDWEKWSMLLDAFRQVESLTVTDRIRARELAKVVGCAVPLAIAEALLVRCRPDQPNPNVEAWALRRSDKIITDTREGKGAEVNLRAALSRRLQLGCAVPSFGGAIGSIARAIGRVIIHPGHYKQHLLTTLGSRNLGGFPSKAGDNTKTCGI